MGDAPLFGLCMIAVAWLALWVTRAPPRPKAEQPWARRAPIGQWAPFDMREPAIAAEPVPGAPAESPVSRRRSAGRARQNPIGRARFTPRSTGRAPDRI